MKKRFYFQFLLILLALGGLLVLSRQHAAGQLSVQPTPGMSAADQINQLSALLSDTDDATSQQQLEAKLKSLHVAQEMQARAQAQPVEKPASACAVRPQTKAADEARPTGILGQGTGPFPSETLMVENQWQDQINGYWFHIYAGYQNLDPQQGGLLLWIEETHLGGFFADEVADGAFTITAVHPGYVMELTTAHGNLRYFDILAQQFVDSSTAKLPALDLPAKPAFDPCATFDTP